MARIILSLALVFGFFANGAAGTEDWQPLGDAQILSALSGRTLLYDDAVQNFLPSGRTSYDAGRLTWGYWRVQQGQFCSQWPPSDLWACYDVEMKHQSVRFVSADGSSTQGRYR